MKTSAAPTVASASQKIEARFIRKIEQFRNDEIRLVMRDRVPSHKVACVNWEEYPYAPEVTFRIAHSDDALAVMFEVEEDHLRAVAMSAEENVWEDSCVEFFVKNPVGEGYYNFELNAIGTLLAARRTSRESATHFSAAQLAEIVRYTAFDHAPIDICDQNSWWAVELIPFSLLGLSSPPAKLDVNLYKCGDNLDRPHFLSWSPITLDKPNFHCPEFFGEIIFDNE